MQCGAGSRLCGAVGFLPGAAGGSAPSAVLSVLFASYSLMGATVLV